MLGCIWLELFLLATPKVLIWFKTWFYFVSHLKIVEAVCIEGLSNETGLHPLINDVSSLGSCCSNSQPLSTRMRWLDDKFVYMLIDVDQAIRLQNAGE